MFLQPPHPTGPPRIWVLVGEDSRDHPSQKAEIGQLCPQSVEDEDQEEELGKTLVLSHLREKPRPQPKERDGEGENQNGWHPIPRKGFDRC